MRELRTRMDRIRVHCFKLENISTTLNEEKKQEKKQGKKTAI